jgi:hypothetical protein
MFTLKFNDTPAHAEHDWLVLDKGVFVAGFATSNGAENWIRAREQERAQARAIFRKARIERALKAAGPRVTKRERALIEGLFS